MADAESQLRSLGWTEQCLAFIDFLGFKNLVDEAEQNANMARALVENLRAPYQLARHLAPHFDRPGIDDKPKIRSFSDLIVISAETPLWVADLANSFYSLALYLDLPMRGAIVRGRLFHDDEVLVGDGLNRAYHLESKVAKVPRVIIENGVMEFAGTRALADGRTQKDWINERVSRDVDGWLFLDPFTKPDERTRREFPDWLSKVREYAARSLDEAVAVDDPGVIEKYRWLSDKVAAGSWNGAEP